MMDLEKLTKYQAGIPALKEKFSEYPRVISIETMVRCNATCSFCPYPGTPRQGEQMETDLVYKILQDLSDIPKDRWVAINLSRINEPLLDKRLREFSEHIQKILPKSAQMFFSNGTTLNPGNYEWISDLAGASLRISLNSVDPVKHKLLMGISFEKVMRNLDKLHKLKVDGKFVPVVTLNGMHQSDQDRDRFVAYCNDRFPLFATNVRPFFIWQGADKAGQIEQANAGLHDDLPADILDMPCGQWFDLNILANGFATKCCIDEAGFSDRDFDLRHNHLLEVYARSQRLRENLPQRRGVTGCETCQHLG